MDPMQILLSEHRLILKTLKYLASAIKRIENGEKVPMAFFEMWGEFYRFFILDYHHFKEEYVMFSELAQKKQVAMDAQIEALRFQHERGRNFMNEANRSLSGYEGDDLLDTSALLENLAAFISLIRYHIYREEHIFFPMVKDLFSEPEKVALAGSFRAEDKKTPPDIWQRHMDVVGEMAQQVKK